MSDTDRSDYEKLYNLRTLGELEKSYRSIAWQEWFTALLPSTIILTENEPVIVVAPSYIPNLEKLIARTPKRVVANYMFWRAVQSLVFYLNDDVWIRTLYYSGISSRDLRTPRIKLNACASETTDSLPLAATALYVKNYFTEETKRKVIIMTENIKAEFKNMLQTVDWMDNATKRSALEKADMMISHIAYPDEVFDDTIVNAFYQNLELGENFLENILNTRKFSALKEHSSLRIPVDKNEWFLYINVAIVNALYHPNQNIIEIPAGIVQGVFFNSDRPMYMNYGGIGSAIAHEIIHSLDNTGRQFDKTGNLNNWWKPAAQENYVKRVQCMIDQYNNYIENSTEKNVDGFITLTENISDNDGVKAAYLAYKAWVAANKPEQKLPGLSYTPLQMYWISLANTYCSTMIPRERERLLSIGRHSPDEFRIIGPLSNSVEFSKDFNCPVGSKMNPIKKCSVW